MIGGGAPVWSLQPRRLARREGVRAFHDLSLCLRSMIRTGTPGRRFLKPAGPDTHPWRCPLPQRHRLGDPNVEPAPYLRNRSSRGCNVVAGSDVRSSSRHLISLARNVCQDPGKDFAKSLGLSAPLVVGVRHAQQHGEPNVPRRTQPVPFAGKSHVRRR